MKAFILGCIFTLVCSVTCNYLWLVNEGKVGKIAWKIQDNIFWGNYILNPLTGRCDNTLRPASYEGSGMTNARYFGCDKFQKLINVKHGH